MESKERQALDAKFNGSKSVLTKREHFAGMAMQGLITKGVGSYESTGRIAVEYAHALLEALEEDND
jgi:hypothetical protein|tara:strand:- start:673 stop:870 length:198 start_codon:yes stop_codon:yes gene_type:complete